MAIIGAHVSAAISLDLSLDRGRELGAEITQIFISPPQQWIQTKHGSAEINTYKDKVNQSGIGPNFIHGTYLINLGTENQELLQKSINWLNYALSLAEDLEITGVIFHLGSSGGRGFTAVADQISSTLKKILADSKTTKPYLILENSAGAGGSVGSKFSELGQIIQGAGDKRVKICLDTCHLFAAGYDIKTKAGLTETLNQFDREVGLKNLVAVHANDCKFDLGSNKDRHENIGDGFIGREGFKNLLAHPAFKDIPFILEVPGFTDNGPDKENVDILKSLTHH